MSTQSTAFPILEGVIVDSERARARIAGAFGHHLANWRPIIFGIALLFVLATPSHVVTQQLEKSQVCPTVSAAPNPAKGPAKATPGRSTLGYMSFSGAPIQSLAASRCTFDSNLKRVSTTLSTTLSRPESTIATFTAKLLKKAAVLSVLLSICWLLSFLYHWNNKHASSDPEKEKGDDLHGKVRVFVGPAAWFVVGLAVIWPTPAMNALKAPSHGIAWSSTAGPLSPSKLSSHTYRVAEANAVGTAMFGLHSTSQLKAAPPALDAVIKGKPVSKATFLEYNNLFKKQATAPDQAGSMQLTANAVNKVATSLNTTSATASWIVTIEEAVFMATFIVTCFWLLGLCGFRAVRGWRYFKRWFFANLVTFGLLLQGLFTLLAINWGGIYAVSFLTAPGIHGGMLGWIWGWSSVAYAFQIAGYAAPWLLFGSVYFYYRITSKLIIRSMCRSDDTWVKSFGNRLASRQRHAVLGKLLSFIFPRFRRRQLVPVSQGGFDDHLVDHR